jgi:polyhydroxyalkanoate synthase
MLNLLPLQTYLGILAVSLGGSQKAMHSLRSGLLPLNPSLQKEGTALQEKLMQVPINVLEKELQKQVLEKLSGYFASIPAFCLELYKYQRNICTTAPVIWQEGSSCLYEYEEKGEGRREKGKMAPSPILIIPSLINRHYILDLEENNSFVQYLADNGINTYLAAWGEPYGNELGFSLDNYITRINDMIDTVYERTGRKMILAGYCMGGLLSLAAAMGKADRLQAIAFLATPWDFHSGDFLRFILDKRSLIKIQDFMGNYNKVPASFVQSLFYYLHAHLIDHKFKTFPFTNSIANSNGDFMAIENWVNDGISMTNAVAKECFIGWVNNNNVAELKWKIHGSNVNPEKLAYLPAFFAIPKKDSIVPFSCAYGLTGYFKDCQTIEPNAGHIGMIAGKAAKTQTWEPFLSWLSRF